jgi:hypothetical protein
MNVDDVDLDLELKDAKLNIDTTTNTYNVYLRKLRKFNKLGKDDPLLPEHLTDRVLAAFLFALGVEMEHKPHHLKSGSAAIGAELLRSELPGIHTAKHLYPKTILMIKVSKHMFLFIKYHN